MMSEARNRSVAVQAVFVALALAGCSASADDPDQGNVMAGALAGMGGAAGGGTGGTGGVAGTGLVGGTTGGAAGVAGVGGAAGTAGTAGAAGSAGSAGTSAGLGGSGGPPVDAGMDSGGPVSMFSFFVTSYEGMMRLANEAGVEPADQGFGGDLGGLAGADMICQTLAEAAGDTGGKTWRAFLSTAAGGEAGGPVHAIERIGDGPWYDANDRLVAENIAGLQQERPDGDPQSVDDLPDEFGQPTSVLGDSHDTLTGSDTMGRFPEDADASQTCQDWTSRAEEGGGDAIMAGHSWPRCAMFGGCGEDMMGGGFPGGSFPGGNFGNGSNWVSDHPVQGCKPGVNFEQNGGGLPGLMTVGAGGGWGAIYCFAILP
jgi:hypothetical protein